MILKKNLAFHLQRTPILKINVIKRNVLRESSMVVDFGVIGIAFNDSAK